MSKKSPNKVHFNIAKIKTEEFAILHALNREKKREVKTEFKFGVDPAKRLVAVITKFIFNQDQSTFLILEVSCHFILKEESWLSWQSKKSLVIPQNFMRHLSMITVGCARGVLHAKTEGTECAGIILPVVDLNKLIQEDLSIDTGKD